MLGQTHTHTHTLAVKNSFIVVYSPHMHGWSHTHNTHLHSVLSHITKPMRQCVNATGMMKGGRKLQKEGDKDARDEEWIDPKGEEKNTSMH